jgi:cytochrome oxidase Cu insertion factor (SCO1/SenC/PrrC family)
MPLLDCPRVRCIVAAALLVAAQGCAKDYPGASPALANSAVDSANLPIHLLDLDGNHFDLWQQSKNRITVVIFTRTDCPVSNRAAPEICRLYEMYHLREVNFYLIYVDPREKPDDIRRHLHDFTYPCPALRDPEHSLVAYCKATTTPEAVVFNKDREITYQGRINNQYVELGTSRAEPTTNDLANAIESTVLGQSVATPRTRPIGCSIADLKD